MRIALVFSWRRTGFIACSAGVVGGGGVRCITAASRSRDTTIRAGRWIIYAADARSLTGAVGGVGYQTFRRARKLR